MGFFKHILVSTDFSDTSQQALTVAIAMARESGSELTITHTCEIPVYGYATMEFAPVDLLTPVAEIAQERLDDLVESVKGQVAGVKGLLEIGVPWERILAAAAASKADLIVVGTHGRRGVTHALLGSVAEKIVRMSSTPVLTVQPAPAT